MKIRHLGSAAFALLAFLSVPAFAQPAAAPTPVRQCFFTNQFESWRAPDARTINIRVRGNQYYRLGLGSECHSLLDPGARLITTFRGSNTVCSPLDWDLKVSSGIGSPAIPCIVKLMTRLTPTEVAALTSKDRP
ncbi:MAG TPA: DUF6491 family protein [Rhizomicrobium sp.]